MEPFVISNPVPTPEEMADMLGMSRERLERIRAIMNAPVPARKPAKKAAKKAAKKTARSRAAKKR